MKRSLKFCALLLLSACAHQTPGEDLVHTLEQARKSPLKQSIESPTKFTALESLFANGLSPPRNHFKNSQALLGKCAFSADPQAFYRDSLSVFVEQDPMLGTLIYVVPLLKGLPSPEFEESKSQFQISAEELARIHQRARQQIKEFTVLQFEYPKNSPLYDLSPKQLEPAAHVSYAQKVKFRVRSMVKGDRSLLMLEHACPHLTGCRLKNSDREFYYLEPMAYCYYDKRYDLNQSERRSLSSFPTEIQAPPAEEIEE